MELYKLSDFGNNHFAWFQALASQIIDGELKIGDESFKIFDLSIHYHSSDFNYPNCHTALAQSKSLQWYFSDDEAHVLDLTFSDENDSNSYGGILIRGIQNKNENIIGPRKVHNKIRQNLGDKFLQNITGTSAMLEPLSFKFGSDVKVQPMFKLPRPNLSSISDKWSEQAAIQSYLHPLRYTTVFPKPTENTNRELEIVFSRLYGYLPNFTIF